MRHTLSIRDLQFSYSDDPSATRGPASDSPDPVISVERLEAVRGQLSVLIGENGCGKTTLLKLISGLLVPDHGTIKTNGADPVLVHQRPYLFAESVWANVGWPLKIRRVPRQEISVRSRAALERVGLMHLARRWAPSLSGGEKQRAALARALVLEPVILLLDEPTSNIDAASVVTLERVLKELASRGTTVVMSTHNLASAYRLADRVVPMRAGGIFPPTVNILRGRSLPPGDEHIGRFEITGGRWIFCPAVTSPRSTAVIRMDDIILSPHQIETSARNRVCGVVRAVDRHENELARVDIEGDICLSSLVTYRSVEEFDLHAGSSVWATFKASAVELF